MTDAQVAHMVSQFLAYQFPIDMQPDGGLILNPSYTAPNGELLPYRPTGTNLLNGTQAEAMVRHMLAGLPSA